MGCGQLPHWLHYNAPDDILALQCPQRHSLTTGRVVIMLMHDLSRDPNLAAAFTEALPLDRVGQGAPKEATRRRSHQKTSLTYWVLMPSI